MTDAVEVKTTVKFKPWLAPNFAIVDMRPRPRQEGLKEGPSIAVSELDTDVVNALAQRWLDDLYSKHGASCPFHLRQIKAA